MTVCCHPKANQYMIAVGSIESFFTFDMNLGSAVIYNTIGWELIVGVKNANCDFLQTIDCN